MHNGFLVRIVENGLMQPAAAGNQAGNASSAAGERSSGSSRVQGSRSHGMQGGQNNCSCGFPGWPIVGRASAGLHTVLRLLAAPEPWRTKLLSHNVASIPRAIWFWACLLPQSKVQGKQNGRKWAGRVSSWGEWKARQPLNLLKD